MYFINQLHLDYTNALRKLEAYCEKNYITITDHFSYDDWNEIGTTSDIETRDWFGIDEIPLHHSGDGYSQGDATDEQMEGIDLEDLDTEYAKRFRNYFEQMIKNSRVSIDNEIKLG